MMAEVNSEIHQFGQIQLQSGSAKRLQEKLSLIKNRIEPSKKRWFWELLQNASDYNEKVSVRLVVTKDKVVFYHDGAPFKISDVLNLISPDSGKDSDNFDSRNNKGTSNIGKFGTGLVSTHILSSVMQVEGLFVDSQKRHFKFSLDLDRSCYGNKQDLIKQMSQARENFEQATFEEVEDASCCLTSFSYILNRHLPKLPAIKSGDIDLEYLYAVLPYTLCFMEKVVSVSIDDNRSGKHSYKIERESKADNKLTFNITKDGCNEEAVFATFSYNKVSTAFQYKANRIMPYPEGMARMFCGLPLVGMEDIGMPFLLNSLAFEPGQERDGVAFDPNANPENSALLKDSVLLYKKVLDYVEKNKMSDAFNIAKMTRRYNGNQVSNTQFYNKGIEGYKQQLLSHAVVKNNDGDFITFAQVKIPFRESKADDKLYKQATFVANNLLPLADDYQAWFDATDFSLFKEQEYTYQMLADRIQDIGNIHSFGKPINKVNAWLKKSLAYLKDCNKYIFAEKQLLPNQLGELKSSDALYVDDNLPVELKDIFNQLYESKNEKIETELLDNAFDSIDVVNRAYNTEKLSRKIDDEIANVYVDNKGDVSKVSKPLNNLYGWMSKSGIAKEKLQSWFKWYYPKRATMIVDMLSDTQREQALIIAQSGKLGALATLASANLTEREMALLVANVKKLPRALSIMIDKVDDASFADSKEGKYGEKLVHQYLLNRYPKHSGYNVVWASRDTNEPCYDFMVKRGEETVCYCDAKTTMRGIANADSIPFFMRRSQWEFLHTLSPDIPYYIARVFLGSDGQIELMRISKRREN